MKRLVLCLLLATPLWANALSEDEEAVRDTLVEDTKAFGRTVEELSEQFDNFFTDKLWVQACARLDRMRELGDNLKKRKARAGYAYARCAAIHLKLGNLGRTDSALGLAKDLLGDNADIKPIEADLHRLLGKQALEKKDLADALAHFELAAAKHGDERKEQDISLMLSKFALQAYDQGHEQEARDAVDASLAYYKQNRDALKLLDSLTFWSKAGWVLGGLAILGAMGALFVALRKKPPPDYDPYDPYAS